MVPLHLSRRFASNSCDRLARRLVDFIVTAQITGIMEDYVPQVIVFTIELEATFLD